MSLADSLGARIGPLPAWLWALVLGGGLYWLAHKQSSGLGPIPTVWPTSGNLGALGTVAEPMGPALQANPVQTSGINTQPGAALAPYNASSIPTMIPIISGGDSPMIGGYVGLRQATPYDYARGGPS